MNTSSDPGWFVYILLPFFIGAAGSLCASYLISSWTSSRSFFKSIRLQNLQEELSTLQLYQGRPSAFTEMLVSRLLLAFGLFVIVYVIGIIKDYIIDLADYLYGYYVFTVRYRTTINQIDDG